VLPLAIVPTLLNVDPLKLTMFSMRVTVLALPIVFGPLLVLMNDRVYLKRHVNGRLGNAAVVAIVFLSFLLALVTIPLQMMGS